MDISNCSGSTSFFLRFFISASCFAKASSLCATTSSDAFCSASSRSTGMPASFSKFSVICWATSSFSQIRLAGWHNSCRSVCHKKSSNSRWSFPVSGDNRVPRPTIWQYRLRTFVGRRTTMQFTDGQSQPSVRSIELQSTLYFPASKSFRISDLF